MIRFEFCDILGKPYIIELHDEETAILFAHEMGLTLIGRIGEAS